MLETVIKSIIAAIGAVTSFMFGGWSQLLGILIVFVILDYVTGIVAAWIRSELKSSQGLKGIAKKVFIFVIVSVAHIVDVLLGNDPLIREAAIIFYIVNELISIIENAGRAGVPIPEKLRNAIELLNTKKKSLNNGKESRKDDE